MGEATGREGPRAGDARRPLTGWMTLGGVIGAAPLAIGGWSYALIALAVLASGAIVGLVARLGFGLGERLAGVGRLAVPLVLAVAIPAAVSLGVLAAAGALTTPLGLIVAGGAIAGAAIAGALARKRAYHPGRGRVVPGWDEPSEP